MQTGDQARNLPQRCWQAILVICLALLIGAAALAPAPADAMPPRPPRATATPITPPAPSPGRTLIVLVLTLPVGQSPADWQALWAGVQWQDAFGAWHDVTGWQGALDEAFRGIGKKTWAVADGHLGSGPYRWLVYARPAGEVVAASAPFYLPSATGDIYEVPVVIGDRPE